MLIAVAVVLVAIAFAAVYGAITYASLALAFAAVACLLAAAAVVMLRRSTHPTHSTGPARASAPPHASVPSRTAQASSRHTRGQPSPGRPVGNTAQQGTAMPARPPASRAPQPDLGLVVPQKIDATSVTQAFLRAAGVAGHAVRVTLWRGDGAGDSAAVPVAVSGRHNESLVKSRESACAAIEQGVAVLDSITFDATDEIATTAWRYIVPFELGELHGAASVDLIGDKPDLEVLNRIAAAYRMPLAASLALEAARNQSDAARTLIETTRELARLLDPDAIVTACLGRAIDLTAAVTGSVMLYDSSGVCLTIAAAVGLPEDVVETTSARPGNGIAGWVALSGQPLVVEDLADSESPARSRGVRSAASVPIADAEGVLGVLNVGSSAHPSRFTGTQLETLKALADQAAVALRNARAIIGASELYFGSIKALALALEARDPFMHGGTERVLHYTSQLAQRLGLPAHEARALEIAGMLRDIGTTTDCEDALSAPRPLTAVERGLVTLHPVIAAEILEQAPALREVAPIVYHHHERYDGSGYVEGLAGEDIPLAARILSVADAFVAMTSDRPHRAALSESEAATEIQESSGTQFDPDVVDAFLAIQMSESSRAPGAAV